MLLTGKLYSLSSTETDYEALLKLSRENTHADGKMEWKVPDSQEAIDPMDAVLQEVRDDIVYSLLTP